ncbi:MAG: NYN domain-containing protein [Ignavibacteriales bacterium]|nr:NYN domain-containing protein [Ignavibacteriales bacterium]
MIRIYFIDGNNLLGKIKNRNISTREKLSHLLDRVFNNKKIDIHLFFDGYAKEPIRTNKIKIFYSDDKTADEIIKIKIEQSKNPKLINVITSDFNLSQFANKCSCKVTTSENFATELFQNKLDDEQEKIKNINNEEVKKLFGL